MVEHNFVDLAVVAELNTGSKYVVQCPAWRTCVGDLVEFKTDTCMNIGEIVSKITTDRNCETYKFINEIDGIVPCVRLWSLVGDPNEHS